MINSIYAPPLNLRRSREIAITLPLERLAGTRQAPLTKGTILIVNDCPPLRDILSRMLVEARYRVESVSGGWEAVTKSHFHPPDLILLDADLPVVNGVEAYSQLRQEPTTRHLPIILTSVYETYLSSYLVKAGGSIDFLAIPASYETLLGRVEQWMRRVGSELDPSLN